MAAPPLEVFKARLEGAWSNLVEGVPAHGRRVRTLFQDYIATQRADLPTLFTLLPWHLSCGGTNKHKALEHALAAPAQCEPSKNRETILNFSQVTTLLITQGRKEGAGKRMGPGLLTAVQGWIALNP